MKIKSFFLIPFFLVLQACNSSSVDSSNNGDEDEEGDDTELTLTSCTTTVDDGAPDFFQNYFRCVLVSSDENQAVIESNGLPPHRSYYYGEDHPNFEEFDTSRGEDYSPNPNEIGELDIHLEIPREPTPKGLTINESMVDGEVGNSDDEYGLGVVGVALDGVALFNPLAAPGDDIDDEQYTFDNYNAHPTGDGDYHYHTNSPGPLEVLEVEGLVTTTTLGEAEIELFGIMCDGTVVMGCAELDGSSPDDSDFDAQNGHVHDLVDGETETIFSDRYHTHICPDLFPGHPYTPEIQYYETCVVD